VVEELNTDGVASGGSKDSRLDLNGSAGESVSLEVDGSPRTKTNRACVRETSPGLFPDSTAYSKDVRFFCQLSVGC
jgi:hypothetical protein